MANQITNKTIEKHDTTQFNVDQCVVSIKDMGDQFHYNFKIVLHDVLHKYMGVNIECTIVIQ
jgi:hypothetical protein